MRAHSLGRKMPFGFSFKKPVEAIKIYTEWANRHLSRSGQPAVHDLTADLREARALAILIQAVGPNIDAPPDAYDRLHASVAATKRNEDGVQKCLDFLSTAGVDVHKVSARDVDCGHLSAVLQLLYALSIHKQQLRATRRASSIPATAVHSSTVTSSPSKVDERPSGLLKPVMPPNTKLPSPQTRIAAPSPASSRLQPPTVRIGTPKEIKAASVSPCRPPPVVASPSLSRSLRPPTSTATSRLQPPKASANTINNNNAGPRTSPTVISSTASTSSYASISSTRSIAVNDLKRDAKAQAPSPPTRNPSTTVSRGVAKSGIPIPPPTSSLPTSREQTPATEPQSKMLKLKLFGGKEKKPTTEPTSVKSSPQLARKVDLKSTPARESSVAKAKTSNLTKPSRTAISKPKEASSVVKKPDHSPLLLRPATTALAADIASEKRARPASKLEPTFECPSVDGVPNEVPAPMPPLATRALPTYSALVAAGRISACPRSRLGQFVGDSSTSDDSLDSVSTTIRGRPPPRAPSASSATSPGRHLPDLTQDGLKYFWKNTLFLFFDIPSGYLSEGAEDIYKKMQARMREYRDNLRQRPDFNDSFEDSSSISSGISENFDDDAVSTSSLSDHQMAAVSAYGKIGEYGNFVRGQKGSRSVSLSEQQRLRRLAEQENISQLLAQCRTSQRGSACQNSQGSSSARGLYHTLGSVPVASLSADGESLSVCGASTRASMRCAPKRQDVGLPHGSGYHSLDRKYHMADLYREDSSPYRLSLFDHRAAMALVSPRRTLNAPPDAMSRHSMNAQRLAQLNSSGMSRSMVLCSPASSPRLTARSATHRESSRSSRRGPSPARVPLPLSVANSPQHSILNGRAKASEAIYANCSGKDLHLHRLNDDPNCRSPSHSLQRTMKSSNGELSGSQLSLASSTAYSSLAERYEAEIAKMNRELDAHRHTISRLTQKHDDYAHVVGTFDTRLAHLSRHVEKSNLKPDEVAKLRQEIEALRVMSLKVVGGSPSLAAAELRKTSQMAQDGAGELLRQPSLESVASHRSSMSSSSKSSKTDKSSLSSFGKAKKSWIRSSFSRAFAKGKNKKCGTNEESSPSHHPLNTISGSNSRLDDFDGTAIVELKKQLEDRDEILTDVRLDALDKAREVDILKETVNRLKNENKQLKQEFSRLLDGSRRRTGGSSSRCSSHSSLPVLGDEEPVYEEPPSSTSSKRNSGCSLVKVTVNVDLSGVVRNAICPDNEIIVGFLPLPSATSTWTDLDIQLYGLFDV